MNCVGGLIGVNDSWFRYRGPVNDMAKANKNGSYHILPNTLDNPIKGYGSSISFVNDYYIVQIVVSWDGGKIYIRGNIGGEWKRISTL